MDEIAYVMSEYIDNGCRTAFNVVSVTLDQTLAYEWSLEQTDECVHRQVDIVPFV